MSRFKIVFIFLVIVASLVFRPINSSQAQASIDPGIDLIILLDQSSSMDHTDPNLPGSNEPGRVYTARYLIDYLAFDNQFVNPDRTNRVMVIGIGYGTPGARLATKVMVGLTSLKAASDVTNAKDGVKAERLNGTSFLSAFEEVGRQFPSNTTDEVTSGQRRRLIVVITDGGPDPLEGSKDFKEYFENLGRIYKSLGTGIYTTFVIGIDAIDAYWSEVKDLWETQITGPGRAIRVEGTEQINKEVVSLTCPFLNETGTGAECRLQDIGNHFIPPYARSASFSFFKYDPSALVTLLRPKPRGEVGGLQVVTNPKDTDVLEYQATPRDQFFALDSPAPGCWRSERIGTGKVDVFTQIAFNDLLITKPSSAHPMISPLQFEFVVNDARGKPLEELPDFPVSFDARLKGPDGRSQKVTVQQALAGLYSSQPSGPLTTPGVYELTLTGSISVPARLRDCFSGGAYSVFSQTIQVPVYMPKMFVSIPAAPYYHYTPLPELTIQFSDDKNHPLSVPVDPALHPDLILISPSGMTRTIDVQFDGNGLRSVVPIIVPEVGTYAVRLALQNDSGQQVFQGESTIEVTDNINVIQPGINYPAFSPLRSVEIELLTESDQPIPDDPNYHLRLEAEMFWPDGRTEMIDLRPSDTDRSRYRALVSWVLTEAAPYTLEIRGYASLLPGMPEQKIFISRKTINVSGNLPWYLVSAPDEMTQNPVYPMHRWFLPPLPVDFTIAPQPIQVELQYGNQQARAEDFFADSVNDLFHLTIVDSAGTTVVDKKLSDISGRGAVFGTDLQELKSEGVYTATVALTGRVRGGIATQGAWLDKVIVFERRDPVIYLLIWALLAIGALILVLIWMLNHVFLPKAKGKLIAETIGPTSRILWEYPITPKQMHHFTIKERNIDARLGLVRIDIRRASPKKARVTGKEEVQEGIEIKAYNEKLPVANGSIYKSAPNRISVKQRTSNTESYQLRYED